MPAAGRLHDLARQVIGAPNWIRRLQVRPLLHLLDVRPGLRLLDIGCGQGWLTAEFARIGAWAVGLDLAADRFWSSWAERDLSMLLGRAEALPLAAVAVDRILASSLLQLVEEPAQVLCECRRVVRPGGRLVFSVSAPFPRLLARYPAAELRRRLQALFHTRGVIWFTRDELAALLERTGWRPVEWWQSPGPRAARVWEIALDRALRRGRQPSIKRMFFALYPPLARDCGGPAPQGIPPHAGEWLVAAVPVRA